MANSVLGIIGVLIILTLFVITNPLNLDFESIKRDLGLSEKKHTGKRKRMGDIIEFDKELEKRHERKETHEE